jgi:hypothetical protein
LKKITFNTSGDEIYFHLSDLSVVSENTANVKRFLFSDTPQGNPLPVELSSFNVLQIGSSVLLKWRTETEINNFGFDVERASYLNGSIFQWRKIGFVEGSGNSNSPQKYSFIDNPQAGSKYYYRLKQIDSDGQFEYSDVICIEINMPNEYAIYQNYPNPFNPSTTIKYNLPVDADVQLRIYDVLGREVQIVVNEFQKAGTYNIPFKAEGLSSGIYFCRMNSGNFNSSIKMILIK